MYFPDLPAGSADGQEESLVPVRGLFPAKIAVIRLPPEPPAVVLWPLLIFLIGYLAFVPLGPLPLHLLGPVKLDNLLSVGLLLLCLSYVPYLGRVYPKSLLTAFVILIATTLVSVLLSPEISYSAIQWLSVYIYAAIAILAPQAMSRRMTMVRVTMLIAAGVVGATILYLYFRAGLGHGARAILSTTAARAQTNSENAADPNITAIGLDFAVIAYIPIFLKGRGYGSWFLIRRAAEIACIALAIAGALVLLSRTAIVASLGSVVMSVVSVLIIGKAKSVRLGTWIGGATVIALILGTVVLAFFLPKIISGVIIRFSTVAAGENHQLGRFELLQIAMDLFSQNLKTFLLGGGFFTINPHNELFRYLSTTGVIGFGALLGFLGLVFAYCCLSDRPTPGYMISQMLAFWFLLISMQTYWQVKMFWVPIMLILGQYLEIQQGLAGPCHRLPFRISRSVSWQRAIGSDAPAGGMQTPST
jgi:hypothetical protein